MLKFGIDNVAGADNATIVMNLTALFVGSLLAVTAFAARPLPPPTLAPHRFDRILVKPKGPPGALANFHQGRGNQVSRTWRRFGNLQLVSIPPGANVENVIAAYERSGLVEYAEPDYTGSLAGQKIPDDTYWGDLWGLHDASSDADIDAPEAWHFRTDASAVVVAVLDTGVRYTHEDLAMNMWVNPGEVPGNSTDDDGNGYVDDVHGIDAVAGSGDPMDYDSHGSWVAGILGAVGNNGKGVCGVAWDTQIMAVNIAQSSGAISASDAIEGIDYAIGKGAHIINASWGISGSSDGLLDSIRAAANHGIIVVAAAGNNYAGDIDDDAYISGLSVHPYPAAYEEENILAVAATTSLDTLADYSNIGCVRVDLGAPGGNSPDYLKSTFNGSDSDYNSGEGTSGAAPHVSGSLALLKAQFPNDSYLQLINRLLASVDPLSALTGKCVTGGRLNLRQALISTFSVPANDGFGDGFELKVPSGQGEITATSNNVDATSESGEPSHAGSVARKSIWWHWKPTSSGTVEFRTQGSSFATRLAVYTGSSVSTLTQVASDSTGDACAWSQVSFYATGQTTYRIAVDGVNGEIGTAKLTVRTVGSTARETLAFDPTTLTRSSGQFGLRVEGPPSASVTLDMFRQPGAAGSWTEGYATFTLSAQGIYNYTDTAASDAYRLYRCRVGALKSCNAVGYVDITLSTMVWKMIANPLEAADNRISALFPSPPDGTSLYAFDEASQGWVLNTYDAEWEEWTFPDMTLSPGGGVLARAPSTYSQALIGEVKQGYLVNPVPSGLSIRSSMRPVFGPVSTGIGSPIQEGDLVLRMVNGEYETYAYRNGFWIDSNGDQVAEPVISVGESFWIHKPTSWQQMSSVWP